MANIHTLESTKKAAGYNLSRSQRKKKVSSSKQTTQARMANVHESLLQCGIDSLSAQDPATALAKGASRHFNVKGMNVSISRPIGPAASTSKAVFQGSGRSTRASNWVSCAPDHLNDTEKQLWAIEAVKKYKASERERELEFYRKQAEEEEQMPRFASMAEAEQAAPAIGLAIVDALKNGKDVNFPIASASGTLLTRTGLGAPAVHTASQVLQCATQRAGNLDGSAREVDTRHVVTSNVSRAVSQSSTSRPLPHANTSRVPPPRQQQQYSPQRVANRSASARSRGQQAGRAADSDSDVEVVEVSQLEKQGQGPRVPALRDPTKPFCAFVNALKAGRACEESDWLLFHAVLKLQDITLLKTAAFNLKGGHFSHALRSNFSGPAKRVILLALAYMARYQTDPAKRCSFLKLGLDRTKFANDVVPLCACLQRGTGASQAAFTAYLKGLIETIPKV